MKIPKPYSDKKDVREELDRFLMKNEENINKMLQETR